MLPTNCFRTKQRTLYSKVTLTRQDEHLSLLNILFSKVLIVSRPLEAFLFSTVLGGRSRSVSLWHWSPWQMSITLLNRWKNYITQFQVLREK